MRRTAWYLIGTLLLTGLAFTGVAVSRQAVFARTYRIGFEQDPPFHFRGPDGKPAGFAVDVVNEAARRRGVRLQWEFHHESSELAIRSGRVDLWPIMMILPERRQYIHFSEPYRLSESCLLVREDQGFSKPTDLDGHSIGCSGKPLDLKVLSQVAPTSKVMTLEHTRGLVESVCRGDIDAAYMDELTVVSELMHGADCAGHRLRVLTVKSSRGQLGVGSTFAAARVADEIRAGISDMAEDGTLSDIVGRWMYFTGRSMELNSELVRAHRRERVLTAAIAFALALVVATGWLALRIRHQRNRARRAEEAQRQGEDERLRLAEQLQQAQRMESIGRLAGGVAHDFNNLLTVMAGYADMLLSDDDLTEDQRLQVKQIADAGTQAANLTQQLLAFSRKQIIRPRALNLNATIQGTATMLRRLVGEDIQLTTELDPALAPVMADPGQLHQVLMNLVVNSRDAMPSGGRLHIATANAVLTARDTAGNPEAAPGAYVVLSVSDTGIGMDAATLDHIFEPFFTTKAKGEGTGLGLSMVYGIVKQSRGWISATSEPGQGAAFRVYLPQADAMPAAVEAAESGTRHPGTETILLVEDQESVRRMAASVLRSSGHNLIEASSGEDALAAAGCYAGAIHLLLTDVVLPGMTGKELADRLRSSRPSMRVLFCSGYAEDVVVHRGVPDVGIRFLPKPYTPGALMASVRQVLDEPDKGPGALADGA